MNRIEIKDIKMIASIRNKRMTNKFTETKEMDTSQLAKGFVINYFNFSQKMIDIVLQRMSNMILDQLIEICARGTVKMLCKLEKLN